MQAATQKSIHQCREYHKAAMLLSSQGLQNPSISAYVHAVIHAKDAICIEFVGRSGSSKNHLDAVSELRATKKVPDEQTAQFADLLKSKNHAEYGSSVLAEANIIALQKKAERFLSFSYQLLGA